MSKWGTSNGSRGGMPKSGMPENSQSGKTKKQVLKPPVGIWVLRSSRMAAMYSSTAGSLNALPCPRAERERRANTILGEVQVLVKKTIQCKRINSPHLHFLPVSACGSRVWEISTEKITLAFLFCVWCARCCILWTIYLCTTNLCELYVHGCCELQAQTSLEHSPILSVNLS